MYIWKVGVIEKGMIGSVEAKSFNDARKKASKKFGYNENEIIALIWDVTPNRKKDP